jgi:large subunit ribosomal protein L30
MAKRKAGGKLKIKWVRSWIACTERQRACVRGLGFRRLNQVVERVDTPAVRGLVLRCRIWSRLWRTRE